MSGVMLLLAVGSFLLGVYQMRRHAKAVPVVRQTEVE